jgi:alanine racemase
MKNWDRIKTIVSKLTDQKPLFHSFASSALLRANMSDDFARCGIATYGYSEIDDSFDVCDLKPVLSLYAEKICTKELKSGQRVGYGGVGFVKKDSTISTYDLGYADGLFRYDGVGDLKFDGIDVIGRISMDSFSATSDKDSLKVIDNAKDIALYFKTISYDILVKLSPYIKREIL